MQVMIRVRTDAALALHHRQPTATVSEELLQAAEELGVVLEPVHPGAEDLRLVPYFTVEVPEPATAEGLIARLQRCKAIEAAYLKPPDEMP